MYSLTGKITLNKTYYILEGGASISVWTTHIFVIFVTLTEWMQTADLLFKYIPNLEFHHSLDSSANFSKNHIDF